MKEVNLYTSTLLLIGLYGIGNSIVKFSIDQWLPYLLIVCLVIILDQFPIKLPNGVDYLVGSIGVILILFKFGLSASMITLLLSNFLGFIKKFGSFTKVKWFRFFVTNGMCYISLFFAFFVMQALQESNEFIQSFLVAATFEGVNFILFLGIRKTVMKLPIFQGILPPKVLVLSTLIYTLMIPRFLAMKSTQEWIMEISFFAVITIAFAYFSTKFTKEIETRKQAEEALQNAQQDLRDTLAHQQGMTYKFKKENGRFLHTMIDGDLLYRLGFTPDMILGKELREFLPAETAVRKEKAYERAWQGEENVSYEGEINGITYMASLRPIFRKGTVIEVIASCIDITERKKAEELLRKSDKLAVAGQLAAGIAHEIRNPLTSIRGFVQLLQKGLSKEEYATIMLSEIDRMDSIIREFLMMAKPHTTNFKDASLQHMLADTTTLFNTQAIMKSVQIETVFSADIPPVLCDENQLKQVFINILKNAIEAMPKGGEVRVEAKMKSSNQVMIRFTDQGSGIPEGRLKKLGEPFYSTKEKGTGLGLMVSYKIIEEHNGTIEIDSEVNKGTTVLITLPVD